LNFKSEALKYLNILLSQKFKHDKNDATAFSIFGTGKDKGGRNASAGASHGVHKLKSFLRLIGTWNLLKNHDGERK